MNTAVDVPGPAEEPVTLAAVAGRWMIRLSLATIPVSLVGFFLISGPGRWMILAQLLFAPLALLAGRSEPRRSDAVTVLVVSSAMALGWGVIAGDARMLAATLLMSTMIYTALMALRPFAELGLVLVPVMHLVGQGIAGPDSRALWQIAGATLTATASGVVLFGIRITTEKRLTSHLAALAEANSRLERLNRQDPLTGLANRRHLDETLTQIRTGGAADEPVSLLMIDIDHFKRYNDHYGHPGGDRCLQEVAELLVHSARHDDVIARYGGEEFAVIMRNTGAGDARRVADRICHSVAAATIEHAAAPAGTVSVSVGVATAAPGDADGLAHLVERADQALYDAKRRGRGRVAEGYGTLGSAAA